MLRSCFVLILTVATCIAIPKGSTKRELQKLVRLPKVEFMKPLEFDRQSGFIAFPEPNTASLEVSRLLKGVKSLPEEAPLLLAGARISDRHGDAAGALRHYSRSIELFRRRLEMTPRELSSLAGLGEALAALGRFGEAQATLESAAENGSPTVELLLARARLYRERAWFSAAGEGRRYTTAPFLQQLIALVAEGPAPRRIEECRKYLALAERALTDAFELSENPDETKAELLLERAAFRSFRSALDTALTQIQNGELRSRALELAIYDSRGLEDLMAAAETSRDPEVIAASALAENLAADRIQGSSRAAEGKVRKMAKLLEGLVDEGGERAGAAAEYLGSIQLQVFNDVRGAKRTLQRALALQPGRSRAWELLTVASAYESSERFVETAEERVEVLPNARSSVLLVKSYDAHGDILRAEWSALTAANAYPNDLLVNLSLAAVLLKDDNIESYLWKVEESLGKAEKAIGSNRNHQNRIDYLLLRSIFLGISGQAEEAKALLNSAKSASAELQEVLRALD